MLRSRDHPIASRSLGGNLAETRRPDCTGSCKLGHVFLTSSLAPPLPRNDKRKRLLSTTLRDSAPNRYAVVAPCAARDFLHNFSLSLPLPPPLSLSLGNLCITADRIQMWAALSRLRRNIYRLAWTPFPEVKLRYGVLI